MPRSIASVMKEAREEGSFENNDKIMNSDAQYLKCKRKIRRKAISFYDWNLVAEGVMTFSRVLSFMQVGLKSREFV